MISFRSARNLRSYLVRAKLHPIERTVESFKSSGKRCQTCLNVDETDTFTSTTTGETSITFIDKIDLSEPLKRENYWRSILKTMAPWGLNVEDSA